MVYSNPEDALKATGCIKIFNPFLISPLDSGCILESLRRTWARSNIPNLPGQLGDLAGRLFEQRKFIAPGGVGSVSAAQVFIENAGCERVHDSLIFLV